MDLRLNDKVVIVTGGARGIGEAICLTLAEEGAIPAIIDKDEAAGESLRQSVAGKSMFFCADLTDPIQCKSAIDAVVKTFGSIYGVVNNAGRNDGVGLENGTPERFLSSMTGNAGHFYFIVHAALPWLKKSKGSIVNISSKTALTGQGNTSGYVAAKGAVLSLTREWAVELAKYQMRVNAVIPAEVWTPMYESWLSSLTNPEKSLQEIKARIPLENRMTRPDEIADTVVFLLSDRASHITGQWIHVDGGYVHFDRAFSKL